MEYKTLEYFDAWGALSAQELNADLAVKACPSLTRVRDAASGWLCAAKPSGRARSPGLGDRARPT